jgi:hypothetical protein
LDWLRSYWAGSVLQRHISATSLRFMAPLGRRSRRRITPHIASVARSALSWPAMTQRIEVEDAGPLRNVSLLEDRAQYMQGIGSCSIKPVRCMSAPSVSSGAAATWALKPNCARLKPEVAIRFSINCVIRGRRDDYSSQHRLLFLILRIGSRRIENNAAKASFAELFRNFFSYASRVALCGRNLLLFAGSACRLNARIIPHGENYYALDDRRETALCHCGRQGTCSIAGRFPLWVKSRHCVATCPCPLYP